MRIAFIGYPLQERQYFISSLATIDFLAIDSFDSHNVYDGIFLYDKTLLPFFNSFHCLVFVHAISTTLTEMNTADNIYRINHWPGFIRNKTWEIAGIENPIVEQIFTSLGKSAVFVPDVPGFISPRILSMIINEAYYALDDKVSSVTEVDIAMTLGTNYPRGPVEWGNMIGLRAIHELLQTLSINDKRYEPAQLLVKKIHS